MPHIWLTSLWRTYTIFIFLILISAAVAAPCQNDQYWNPMKDTCIQCKLCGDQEFVVRPCQPHMDTICGDIKDFKFNWNWLERSDVRADEIEYKEERRRDREDQEEAELQDEHASEIVTQWQIASLIIAVTACLFFFITVAFISLNHTRQWRRIEKHFDADMEELSAQLMARLTAQNMENGTILLEDPLRKNRPGHPGHPIEVRCVYLEQLLDGKNSIKHPGPGNVYIEESSERQGSTKII